MWIQLLTFQTFLRVSKAKITIKRFHKTFSTRTIDISLVKFFSIVFGLVMSKQGFGINECILKYTNNNNNLGLNQR